MATMGACRLLLVCVFCALWGGQVIANDKGTTKADVKPVEPKAKEAEGAMQNVLANLAAAGEFKKNISEELEKDDPDYKEGIVKGNVTELVKAVTDATKEAEKAKTAAEDATVKASLSDFVNEVEKFLTEVKKVDEKAKEIQKDTETLPIKKVEFKPKVGEVETLLTTAKAAATKAMEALTKELQKTLDNKGESSGKTEKDSDTLTGKKKNEASDGGKDDLNSQTNAQNSGADSQQGTTDNKSSTDGQHKNTSTSSSTHENNTPDAAHGGAIATCTAAPLLLLLTAVAYAAVC